MALSTLGTAALLVLAPAASAQEGAQTFQADLQTLNDSGATGTATLTVEGDQLTVEIESEGLTPEQPHAQHIHGDLPDEEIVSECPSADADEDGDGLVNTAEGQPFYGMVLTSLTTEGDVGPDSGLAVDRFPVADADGSLSYSRTFTVNPELDVEDLADYAIVQHGIDLDDSGAYDGDAESSLDPSLPLEATIPADCGTIEAVDGDDNGEEMDAPDEVAAGSGGFADTGLPMFVLALMGTGVALLGGGVLAARRK